MAFGNKTVREVMTARPAMVTTSADVSLEDLRQLVIHEQFSRIPVYEDNIDQIIGFIHVRDMFELITPNALTAPCASWCVPSALSPETKPVNDLLRNASRMAAWPSSSMSMETPQAW